MTDEDVLERARSIICSCKDDSCPRRALIDAHLKEDEERDAEAYKKALHLVGQELKAELIIVSKSLGIALDDRDAARTELARLREFHAGEVDQWDKLYEAARAVFLNPLDADAMLSLGNVLEEAR